MCKLRQDNDLWAQSLILSTRHQPGFQTQPAKGDAPGEWPQDQKSAVRQVHQGAGQISGVNLSCLSPIKDHGGFRAVVFV